MCWHLISCNCRRRGGGNSAGGATDEAVAAQRAVWGERCAQTSPPVAATRWAESKKDPGLPWHREKGVGVTPGSERRPTCTPARPPGLTSSTQRRQ